MVHADRVIPKRYYPAVIENKIVVEGLPGGGGGSG
jgi:hypothetical protein